tara:strand:+ start:875 stop:1048 length:174 start_codon:yes stop_codon:yes gene_type:complete
MRSRLLREAAIVDVVPHSPYNRCDQRYAPRAESSRPVLGKRQPLRFYLEGFKKAGSR